MSNFIKGECRTNLDGYIMAMATQLFYRVPNIGELVSCFKNGKLTTLRVCQITHCMMDNEPFIIVELHL
jgi:hypothetical protein